ncbi:MAG: hypothetical protein ABIQ57_17015 [Candidatus Kapaibacterium sp.]
MDNLRRQRIMAAAGHLSILVVWLIISACFASDGWVLWLIGFAGIAAGLWSALYTEPVWRFSLTLALMQPFFFIGIIILIVWLKHPDPDPGVLDEPRRGRGGEGMALFMIAGFFLSLIGVSVSFIIATVSAWLWKRIRDRSRPVQ